MAEKEKPAPVRIGTPGKAMASILVIVALGFAEHVIRRIDTISEDVHLIRIVQERQSTLLAAVVEAWGQGDRFTCEQGEPIVRIIEAMLNRNRETIDFEPRDLEVLAAIHEELRAVCGNRPPEGGGRPEP